MPSIYLFNSATIVPKGALEDVFLSYDSNPKITYFSSQKGMIETEGNIDDILLKNAMKIHERLGLRIAFLKVHKYSDLTAHLLDQALGFYPNMLSFMSDILFKEMTFGNFMSMPLLNREFANVPKEIMETMGAYLRHGLNMIEAAKSLYVHRNTFLFRMHKFLKTTNLDIRDYHDALLLEIHFQMNKR